MKNMDKRYEGTINALHVLANQKNLGLLNIVLKSAGADQIISYLRETKREPFAHYLSNFVKKDEEKAREM